MYIKNIDHAYMISRRSSGVSYRMQIVFSNADSPDLILR